jgi:hypothetical protein
MGRFINPNPEAYNLAIDGRGQTILPKPTDSQVLHHIIPNATLRDFWNTAVAQNLEQLRETLVPKLRLAMQSYPQVEPDADTAKKVVAGADQLLRMIWSGNYVHSATIFRRPADDIFENFTSIYIWMPGNLFAGPYNRADDPQLTPERDQFDRIANRFVGQERYNTLLQAYKAIGHYLNQRPGNGYTADPAGTRKRTRDCVLAQAAGLALGLVSEYDTVSNYDPSKC